MTLLNPTDLITVVLEAQQWNTVLASLADGPFRVVAPLIQEIQRQCNPPPAHHEKTNGAETRETSP